LSRLGKRDFDAKNKLRQHFKLPLLVERKRSCDHCGKPIVCYEGEIWCSSCRDLMRHRVSVMPHEYEEPHISTRM
jgi:hypothetical protein